ncbi:MAG: pilus assembly protein TadE [Novosphingobium sp. 17-62-19]|uniref:TadE/TadG family type IV pilus assembly protein n=1 Tax=Novosphingobium sp. 17-62-19 TaxID=1970406 RepID=UPI000BD0CAF3|nr:pilus assembly protein TadE [Novosphingobium sp. 17-62-19]OYX94203.1 MAG: pilus assembly protein TadE [Novosphingobium sp. 35-62-5]OZA21006.1 MAG: pilus assembly protein TadE [Novosphingobium sp. 17-62-19]HQS95480.1 pilus assembly protein TadE [Novosphingobium sp.]
MINRRLTLRPLRSLIRNSEAVSVLEFALVLPVFMTLGMYGAEIAWLNAAALEVSQVAVSMADNASRMGQTDNSGVTPTISDADVDSVLAGALEEGSTVALEENGRVILSSLEAHPVTGKQRVHWQQCKGKSTKKSTHGKPDDTGLLPSVLNGLVLGGKTITAPSGSAVMIAEVWYEYNGLFGTLFVDNIVIHEEAAVIARDDRSISSGLVGSGKKNDC